MKKNIYFVIKLNFMVKNNYSGIYNNKLTTNYFL